MSGVEPDIVVSREEDIPEILVRIRAQRAPRVVLDCAEHPGLKEQGHLRRALAAAAADLGKTLVFYVRPPLDRLPRASASRALDARSVTSRPRRDWFGARPVGLQEKRAINRIPALAARPVRLLTVFAFVAGSLLASVVIFVLPRARVTLATVAEPLSADITLELAAGAAQSAVSHPARHVVVEESVQAEFPVETVVETGERARGTVALVNRTRSPQGIKSGTRLQSAGGVIVRTERDVIIPPLAKAPVAVRADAGGTAANFAPQRLSLPALKPESQRLLFAEVTEPLRGGEDRPVLRLAAADVARGVEALKGAQADRLKEKLQAEFGGTGKWLALSDLARIVAQEETPAVAVGTEVEKFQLRAKVRAEALTVPVEELKTSVRATLRARAGEGKEVALDPNLDDLRVLDVRWDELRAVLSLHVETTSVPELNLDGIKEQLGGRSLGDAEAFLKALAGVRSASVLLSPVWVKHVPENRRNVHIKIERVP